MKCKLQKINSLMFHQIVLMSILHTRSTTRDKQAPHMIHQVDLMFEKKKVLAKSFQAYPKLLKAQNIKLLFVESFSSQTKVQISKS